jgi:outer membrane lipoprotein-sorting protein
MVRKFLAPLLVIALFAGLLAAALAGTAHGAATLPKLTPAELIVKMAAELPGTQSVHGSFSWTNDLLGSQPLRLPAGAPADAEKLLPSGSGQVWYQDGKVRVEIGNGDTSVTVVKSGDLAWLYRSLGDTAFRVTLPADAVHGDGAGTHALSPLMVNLALARLAPAAGVAVGQENVAGREAYVLTLTPTSDLTTFGSATLAVDGQTFVPLRVQVFARGSQDPVFSAGFTEVSFDSFDAGVFDYAPPSGATIERKTAPAHEGRDAQPGKDKTGCAMPPALTLAQARDQAGFPVAALADPVAGLPFQDARVVKPQDAHGPVAVLRYGSGFGTVVLAEAQAPAAALALIQRELGGFSAASSTTVAGTDVRLITTPLLNVAIWQRAGVTLAAGGLVPQDTLLQFVAGVR